jgi:hypothetical protein
MSITQDNFGTYVGKVQTEWLDDGRKMKLLSDFSYIDPQGIQWNAPKGSIIDGASIPKIAWSIIGGPFEGRYRNASIIHDVACEEEKKTWESVHEVFYCAMIASEVLPTLALVMYAAVYHFGPRWPRKTQYSNLPSKKEEFIRKDTLSRAAPNSKVNIVKFHSNTTLDLEDSSVDAPIWNFNIEVIPPQRKLSEEDFEELKAAIMSRESNVGKNFSLEEIRNYRPIL